MTWTVSPSRRTVCGALLAGGGRAWAEPSAALLPPATWAQPFAGGTLTRYAAVPAAPLLSRNVDVWTPRGYPQPGVRYAGVYLSDGQNLFRPQDAFGGQTWGIAERLQALIDAKAVRPALLVGVWNTPRRGQEYAPTNGQSAVDLAVLAADWGGPVVSDTYVAFVADRLKPAIDRAYRTAPEREGTFAMGSSMGGLIALDEAVSRPTVFAGAACLSTHWPMRWPDRVGADPATTARIAQAWLSYVDARLPMAGAADAPRLYFDHGDRGLDAAYAPFQARMDAMLSAHGYRVGRDFESLVFPGATHNETAWRARVAGPLTFLLS